MREEKTTAQWCDGVPCVVEGICIVIPGASTLNSSDKRRVSERGGHSGSKTVYITGGGIYRRPLDKNIKGTPAGWGYGPTEKGRMELSTRVLYTPTKPPDGIYIHLGLSVFSLQSIFLSYRNQGGEYSKETLKFLVSDLYIRLLELTNRNRSAPLLNQIPAVCAQSAVWNIMSEHQLYI